MNTLTPPRILRTAARTLRHYNPEERPEKFRLRHAAMLAVAIPLIARFGRDTITTTSLAHALDMPFGTFRRHFSDIDELVGEILRLHLIAIRAALAAILPESENHLVRRRHAYWEATREAGEHPTDAHLILQNTWDTLPFDVRGPLQEIRSEIAALLEDPAETTLAILDRPLLRAGEVETILDAAKNQRPTARLVWPPQTNQAPARDCAAEPDYWDEDIDGEDDDEDGGLDGLDIDLPTDCGANLDPSSTDPEREILRRIIAAGRADPAAEDESGSQAA